MAVDSVHKDSSSLEDLAAAWDSVEATDDNPPGITDEEISNERLQSAELADPDSKPQEPTDPPEGKDTPPAEPELGLSEVQKPPAEEQVPADPDERCPVGLSATARETWKDTPKAMKAEIVKRERDFSMGMQRNAEGAQRAEQMEGAMRPFAQYFAMNNQTPAQGVMDLLQTAATLQMGSPQQRAQTIHNLIQQFGVDVPALDQLITGGQPAEDQPQPATSPVGPDIQRMIAQAVAPYQQHMAQQNQQQQQYMQNTQNEAAQDLQDFAGDGKHEFYTDVRGVMADLLDMAGKRGQVMSLQAAYDNACRLDPQIDKIVQSRVTTANLTKKRRAAVSTSGTMGGPGAGSGGGDESLTATLNAAWDAAENPGHI